MRLSVSHHTRYDYDRPFVHAVQSLRLRPLTSAAQKTISWRIDCPGIERAARYCDAFGNEVDLVTPPGEHDHLVIHAEGVIDIEDRAGVVGHTHEAASPAVFLRATERTALSADIKALAHQCRKKTAVDTLHSLLTAIHQTVAYDTDATHALTTAAEAFRARKGVCQDHAHIFIAAARALAIPARYVTGYLLIAGQNTAVAHHAWAEAFTDELGWIGFDPANGHCPSDRYARLAVGFDAVAAAPIRGSLRGSGAEDLAVTVVVAAGEQ